MADQGVDHIDLTRARQMSATLDGLPHYLELLDKWSKRINLIGPQARDELLVHHVADSLMALRHIPASAERVIDVGSGAGFPGLILAMARRDLHITMLEPVHKKHAFLCTAARELGLSRVRPLAQRMEEHRQAADFRAYDVAISRATFALPDWLARACELVRPGGLILGMEGREEHELPAGAERLVYTLEGRHRAIVVWRA